MSSTKYHITEPHPSVPKSLCLLAGRGGAGNFTHVDTKDLATSPDASGFAGAAKPKSHSSKTLYTAGRGGAGNFCREQEHERGIFSFDEELERQRKLLDNQAPVFHIGRGGAGNFVDDSTDQKWMRSGRRFSSSSASSSSGSVRRSVEGTLNKLRTSFGRQ